MNKCIIIPKIGSIEYDRTMKYIDYQNEKISSYGLGTTGFWSGKNPGLQECIITAYNENGMNLFDTAEMYGNGRCEAELGKALKGISRENLFIVDKIHPDHANVRDFDKSLSDSLIRLEMDYIDLYLLHWREKVDLSFLVRAMHRAQKAGKIRYWGVSNFDINDLEDLFEKGGDDCFCNQIFYTLFERGAEAGLLPLMKKKGILPMSYSSLGSNYYSHPDIHRNHRIMSMCGKYGVSPEACMLRMNAEAGFTALFSTSSLSHLRNNLQEIPDETYTALKPVLDEEFPAPEHLYPLVKI